MTPGERTLRRLAAPLYELLDTPGVTDLYVRRPGVVHVKRDGVVAQVVRPELTLQRLEAICVLSAWMVSRDFGPSNPRCSSVLPSDERVDYRVQASRPPLVEAGTISLSIRRRASDFVPTLEWLSDRGYFSALDPAVDWPEWWQAKVEGKATILLGGNTGSSKTTFAEALIRAIPLSERLVTVEKTREWFDLPHESWQPLFYGHAGDDEASEAAAAVLCVQDSLRMDPDRICLGELRSGGESWAYLRALMAGHPGGVGTIHSRSAAGAQDAYCAMLAQSTAGSTRSEESIRDMVGRYVDLFAHCAKGPYRVTEVLESDRIMLREVA